MDTGACRVDGPAGRGHETRNRLGISHDRAVDEVALLRCQRDRKKQERKNSFEGHSTPRELIRSCFSISLSFMSKRRS